ncbi:MAG TPA: ATP-binding protein [Blastocatellia bacterium]
MSKLAYEEVRQLDTLPALAGFERGLDWLNSDSPLADDLKNPLLTLKDISQAVDAALQSDTPRNKISQLRLAAEKAASLRQSPGEFATILTNWQKLIADGLAKAEEERRVLEPIRQVYFNDGKPISPDELPEEESPFKGRLETVRQLEAALTDGVRATLLLYGNRRSGKSSLLLQLPRKLGPQVLPAFLDCQSARFVSSDTASGLLIGLAEEIIEQARRNADKHRRDTVKFPRLDREAFKQDPYPAFDRWLKGAEKALGERSLLLCLDEFEKLEEALATGRIDARFLSMLRNIIQHHRRITVLLAGSHHLDELPPRWADALVTTQSLKIGFLDEADARELIVHPVKDFPRIYEPLTVERIIELTHSQPYLVQLLCGLLVEKMNRERREPPASYVTLADVEAVIPLALERGEAYFIDLWRSQTGGNLARRVLEKLAFAPGEQATSAEIKQLTGDEEELRETIRALLRREIIEPTAGGYRILVPLIACYVRDQRQPI